MYAYFDIKNLSSFTASATNPLFDDCCRMLRNHFDLEFNFTKDELAVKAEENPTIKSWLTTMTQGIKGSISYLKGDIFPPRPLKANVYKKFNHEQLMAVYLIDDPRIATIKENGCIMYAAVGEEVEVLSSLLKDSDYQFHKSFELRRMSNWDELNSLITPTTDIIIVDQYCLSDPSVYNNNIYALLPMLCQKVKNSVTNITIFTMPKSYNKTDRTSFEPKWDEIRTIIKRNVKCITGQDPNVTFVLSSDMKEHDRTIFTNYQYVSSGDSINIFDSQWRVISHGRHLGVYSHAHRDHLQAMNSFISDMQSLIDKVKRCNMDNIKFDKTSCFLKF